MRARDSITHFVWRSVGWLVSRSVTLSFFYDFISLTSLLLPKWSCPPARDFGSRVSGSFFFQLADSTRASMTTFPQSLSLCPYPSPPFPYYLTLSFHHFSIPLTISFLKIYPWPLSPFPPVPHLSLSQLLALHPWFLPPTPHLSLSQQSSLVPNFSLRFDNPAWHLDFLPARVLTLSYLPVLNFWLLLCPHWLIADWTMGTIQPMETLTGELVV